jgi:hypothetical protein
MVYYRRERRKRRRPIKDAGKMQRETAKDAKGRESGVRE